MASAPRPNIVGQKIGVIGEGRTVGYAAHGAAGMLTLFIRGVLCNWMVSTGVVGAMVSTNVTGKVIAMWMPIMVFFYMGFEHSIVNMFLFPSGLMLGGNFSISTTWSGTKSPPCSATWWAAWPSSASRSTPRTCARRTEAQQLIGRLHTGAKSNRRLALLGERVSPSA
jgi:hypothetical protein